ncbi:MAG: hypothetical protein ACYSVY_25200, partial [Planctomycetota bacterium]
MKRIAVLCFFVAFLVGCQDSIVTPPDDDGPNLAILDGSRFSTLECADTDPCYHFFWLPPIVPKPKPNDFHGDVNGELRPTLFISLASTDPDITNIFDTSCVIDEPVAQFFDEISFQGDRYKVNVQTGEPTFVSGNTYRFCVRVGAIELGYRDVRTQDGTGGGSRTVASQPILPVEHGKTLSTEFRIEDGALCGTLDLDNCVEQFVPGGQVTSLVSTSGEVGAFLGGVTLG